VAIHVGRSFFLEVAPWFELLCPPRFCDGQEKIVVGVVA
jgi:hypothetical protein